MIPFSEELIKKAMALHSRGRVVLERELGLSSREARRLAAYLKGDVKKEPSKTQKVEFRENQDGASLSGVARSLEELLEKANVDTDIWEVKTYEIKDNAWDVTMKNVHSDLKYNNGIVSGFKKQDGAATYVNSQFFIRATLVRRTDETATKKFRDEIKRELQEYSPVVREINRERKSLNGALLLISIPDVHLGKVAYSPETGTSPYNLDIAIATFDAAIDELVEMACRFSDYERVLFVVGNDLFNSDINYPNSMTTRGTPQFDGNRWQEVQVRGRQMIIRTIELLKLIAPVDVFVVPGNHDFQRTFYLGDALEMRYLYDANVQVNNSPRTRKYYPWGRCLLGFVHGSAKDETEQRLVHSMLNEAPRELGINPNDMPFKEMYCGDIHHFKSLRSNKDIDKTAEDVDGVIIKYLRTIMPRDSWESQKGYESQKGAHCFVWTKEGGNRAEFKFNL